MLANCIVFDTMFTLLNGILLTTILDDHNLKAGSLLYLFHRFHQILQ